MIMRSDGHIQCKSAADCDPRGCRVSTHVVCKNTKCTCGHGSPIGGQCSELDDCYLSGCRPNSHVLCIRDVCTCVRN